MPLYIPRLFPVSKIKSAIFTTMSSINTSKIYLNFMYLFIFLEERQIWSSNRFRQRSDCVMQLSCVKPHAAKIIAAANVSCLQL